MIDFDFILQTSISLVDPDKKGHGNVLVDYKKDDYRGFCLCIHKEHGLLMLYCTRKLNKGPHYQLAGGHVDEPEFLQASLNSDTPQGQLYLAGRAGMARELFEETGLDMREDLDRMQAVVLRKTPQHYKDGGRELLPNEYKHRLFYILQVEDQDFLQESPQQAAAGLLKPLDDVGKQLRLKVSHEHQGFRFEKDPVAAMESLQLHSGGKVSEALRMALESATSTS